MAYDSNPAATHDPTTGDEIDVAWGDLVNADLAYLGAAWTSFTPAWTASSVNPAIGDGTITGAYRQVGKTLWVRVRIVMGASTTYGTGEWRVTLPNSLTSAATIQAAGAVYALDSGTAYRAGAVLVPSSVTYVTFVNDGNANSWSPTSPHTWANGDSMSFGAVLEVA